MRRRVVRAASPELLWSSNVSPCSGESTYRELDDVFLQTQTRIWLGELLHIRFDEETAIADLLADGELLFQVSKVVWKMLLEKHVDLKHSKIYIYQRTSSGKSDGRYMPYSNVDSFLKICQILGLTGIDLFSPSDVVEKRDVRRVCMCIRSLSKKSRLKNLDVPDFDLVTYTIAMPTDLVGGIRRNLEQSQSSSSSSNGCSTGTDFWELYREKSICGDLARYYDLFSESDEAESAFMEHDFSSPLSNKDKVDTDNCSDNGFLFLEDRFLEEAEQCDIRSDTFTNSNLYDIKTNKDRDLHEPRNDSSSVDTDATDRSSSSPSEAESSVTWDLSLLHHSTCHTQKSQSCVESGNLESIGSSSLNASRKQIMLEVLDDFEIDQDYSAVSEEDSAFTKDNLVLPNYSDHPLNTETPQTPVILTSLRPAYMVGREACAQGSVEAQRIMKHKEAEATEEADKGIVVEEFEMQIPIQCPSGRDKEGETGELQRPGKKVLKSIAGGITLAGALFFLLQLKGRRKKEKIGRIFVPLQSHNSSQEQVTIGSTSGVYPTDRLKF